jgi:hypothetical protein
MHPPAPSIPFLVDHRYIYRIDNLVTASTCTTVGTASINYVPDPSSGRCRHFLDETTKGRKREEEGRKGEDWLSSVQTGHSGAAKQC